MNTLTLGPSPLPSAAGPAVSRAAAFPAAFRIAPGAVLRLAQGRNHTVEVIEGRLWLTAAGDSRDHVLGPGGRHALHGAREVVMEALGPGSAWLRLTRR